MMILQKTCLPLPCIKVMIALILMTLVQPGFARAQDKSPHTRAAYFASGCFWCTESDFEKLDGVKEAVSGYMGGDVKDPGYDQVSSGTTGHYELVKVIYDPDKISYFELLKAYWPTVDPYDAQGQFCDRGPQYRAAIFYNNERQEKLARLTKQALEESEKLQGEIVTKILPATTFWRAEAYHQDYYKKRPLRYKFYRYNCGRDARLEDVWGDLDLKSILGSIKP